jgi:hypothetical protein
MTDRLATARTYLRQADPALAKLIDEQFRAGHR